MYLEDSDEESKTYLTEQTVNYLYNVEISSKISVGLIDKVY